MVVRDCSCWVRLQDGTRVELTAVDVVTWDTGEYVEYGSNPGQGCKAEIYWSAKPPERA